jgi:hypothetical protein
MNARLPAAPQPNALFGDAAPAAPALVAGAGERASMRFLEFVRRSP